MAPRLGVSYLEMASRILGSRRQGPSAYYSSRGGVREDDPSVLGRLQHVISRGVEGDEVALNIHGVASVRGEHAPGGAIRQMHMSCPDPSYSDRSKFDVSVVDGFNEKIQINLTPTNGKLTQLGPPVGKLGNQKIFGVFPYACTICAGIKNTPCGDAGKGECKLGTESNPDVPCQYQMTEPNGLVEVLLLPK
jgi:hypothetical protein